jgi:hypothetical protein
MTVGLSATAYANKILDHVHRAVASTAPAGNFIKLHIGDPGAAGAGNVSSVTTRPAATFSAAAAGSIVMSNTPTWAVWAGTNNEVVTHISNWDANTAGTFLHSAVLATPKTVFTGDTLTLASLTVSYGPIAA